MKAEAFLLHLSHQVSSHRQFLVHALPILYDNLKPAFNCIGVHPWGNLLLYTAFGCHRRYRCRPRWRGPTCRMNRRTWHFIKQTIELCALETKFADILMERVALQQGYARRNTRVASKLAEDRCITSIMATSNNNTLAVGIVHKILNVSCDMCKKKRKARLGLAYLSS